MRISRIPSVGGGGGGFFLEQPIAETTLFLVMYLGVAKLAGNKQNVLLLWWLNEDILFQEKSLGDFFFCYRACSLIYFDLVIPYLGPIHPAFMSYIPQQS